MSIFYITLLVGGSLFLLNLTLWIIGLRKLIKYGRKHPSTKRFFVRYAISLIVFLIIAFGGFAIFWFYPGYSPTSLTALRRAQRYLKSEYGKSPNGWNISTIQNTINPQNPTSGFCLVKYEYANRKGTLKASWTTNQCFTFEKYIEK